MPVRGTHRLAESGTRKKIPERVEMYEMTDKVSISHKAPSDLSIYLSIPSLCLFSLSRYAAERWLTHARSTA